jgi:DNA-binding NtrC family response regulator
MGFDCHVADNGRDALDQLQSNPYSIVITDIALQGMDGMELMRQIRKSYPATDVIISSGFFTEEHAPMMLAARASDFLAKPFRADSLKSKITRIMGKQ